MKTHKVTDKSKYFYACDGTVIVSLASLQEFLEKADHDSFKFHKDYFKDEFADWVENTFEMPDLAQKMRDTLDKKSLIKLLKHYLKKEGSTNKSLNKGGIFKRAKKLFKRSPKKHDISKMYWQYYEEFKEKVEDRANDIGSSGMSEMYLKRVPIAIRLYEKTKEETDAIRILHLFYEIEEELESPSSYQPLNAAFDEYFLEKHMQLIELGEQGFNIAGCRAFLKGIEDSICSFKEMPDERKAIALLHRFYELEDNISRTVNDRKQMREGLNAKD